METIDNQIIKTQQRLEQLKKLQEFSAQLDTAEEINTRIGSILREIRLSSNKSLDDVCAVIPGLTKNSLSLMELGKQNIPAWVIYSVALFLNVSVDCFFKAGDAG